MNPKVQTYVAASLSVVTGAWILLIPVITSVTGGALTMILITGSIIAITGLVELFWKNELPSWIEALAALGLLISAFAFTMSSVATWHMALAALVAFALAIWGGEESYQLDKMRHLRT